MAINTTAANDAGRKENYWEWYQRQAAADAAKVAADKAAAKEFQIDNPGVNNKELSIEKSIKDAPGAVDNKGKYTYGNGTPSATEPETPTTPTYSGGGGSGAAAKTEEPGIDMTGITSAYQNAMNVLKEAEKGQPIYDGSYDDQIAEIMGKITGRGKFEYDLSADGLYQQYKDQYMLGAKNAMRDTMGQAAALTGGYGSSYGQMVGQQAYDQQLQQLNNVVPELYGMAYDMYQDEGNRLFDELGMFMDMDQLAYDRYTDDYNRWLTERSYADAKAQDALAMQDENLTRLEYLMSLGYKPTAQEIADAGLNLDMYKAIAKQYEPKASGGGGVYTAPTETGGGKTFSSGYTAPEVGAEEWTDYQAETENLKYWKQSGASTQELAQEVIKYSNQNNLSDEEVSNLMAAAGLNQKWYKEQK